MSPQSIWLWRSVMLIFRRLRRLWLIETPFWKGRHKILSVVGTKEDGSKEPGSDPRPDLGESPREAGGNWSSHWGKDTGGSHFGEPVLPCGHWCWQAPFWNTPSSVINVRSQLPPPPIHKCWDSSGQATNQVGHSSTHQQTGHLNTPEPTAVPEHDPSHHRAQDAAAHTSVKALEPELPELHSQRHWDPALTTSRQAKSPESSETHTSKPALAWGPASSILPKLFQELQRKECFQTHSMRPATPWYQNQIKIS